jgi:PhzF family phenazine biosynthesis protein
MRASEHDGCNGGRMVKLKLWQIDAFAEKALEGNPAAIVPLESWIDASLMQKIANENNLAETAFFVKTAPGKYDLRWFTPEAEVDLCGHATLASAYLVFSELDSSLSRVDFETRSGTLTVEKKDGRLVMSLPSDPVSPFEGSKNFAKTIGEALGTTPPAELHQSRYVLAVWPNPKDIRAMAGPGDIGRVMREIGIWGCIVTAPGDEGFDFISRFFAPEKGVPEDPVTGSAHCALVPYWSKRLNKKALKARQTSPRGGNLLCIDDGARTILAGNCALYMRGEIEV